MAATEYVYECQTCTRKTYSDDLIPNEWLKDWRCQYCGTKGNLKFSRRQNK